MFLHHTIWNFQLISRQYYTYISDKRCKRLGSQAWVFICIAFSELILNLKFGKDILFSNTQMMKIVMWIFVNLLISLLGMLASMKYYRYKYPVDLTEESEGKFMILELLVSATITEQNLA